MFNIAIFTFHFYFRKNLCALHVFYWFYFCLSLEKYLFYFVNNGVGVLKASHHLTPLYSHNDMLELFCDLNFCILFCAVQ